MKRIIFLILWINFCNFYLKILALSIYLFNIYVYQKAIYFILSSLQCEIAYMRIIENMLWYKILLHKV